MSEPSQPPFARLAAVVVLLVAPPLALLIAGVVAFAAAGPGWLAGFALAFAACWFVAWRLARGWLAPRPAPDALERAGADRAAHDVVVAHVARIAARPPETLAQPRAMLEDALALAQDVARQYHPDAADPFARHTSPELAAAASLAFERLERRIDELVPGSHLFTIEQWRRVAQAPRWVARAGGALASLKSALGGARASSVDDVTPRGGAGLRADALATMHAAFLRELGLALIEMSAGRLRDGSEAYRAARAQDPEAPREQGLARVWRQLRHARASWVRAERRTGSG